jgi:hypothetical protein
MSFVGWFVGLLVAGTINFCPALAALVSPAQNIIFLTGHFFTFLSPHRPATWQADVLGRLSLCLWVCFTIYCSKYQQPVILLVLKIYNYLKQYAMQAYCFIFPFFKRKIYCKDAK